MCALVEKLKGKPLLDYLREKCLNEIGFSKDAYFIRDPFGVSMGGSGLMARPLDLLKVGLLLLNRGKTEEGKPLLPENYLKEACSFQVPTVHTAAFPEESFGYGYQFWRIRRDGYACYGMGGQLVILLPKEDLLCVTVADTQERKGGTQEIYDALYAHVLPLLHEAPLPEGSSAFFHQWGLAYAFLWIRFPHNRQLSALPSVLRLFRRLGHAGIPIFEMPASGRMRGIRPFPVRFYRKKRDSVPEKDRRNIF